MSSLRILNNKNWYDSTVRESKSSSYNDTLDAFLKVPPPSPQNSNSFSLESVFSEHLSNKINAGLSPSHGFDYPSDDRLLEKRSLSPLLTSSRQYQPGNRSIKRSGFYKRDSAPRHSCCHHHQHSHRFRFAKRPSRIPVLSARLLMHNVNKRKGKKRMMQRPRDTLIRALDRVHLSDPRSLNAPAITTTYVNETIGSQSTLTTVRNGSGEIMNEIEHVKAEEMLARDLDKMAIQ